MAPLHYPAKFEPFLSLESGNRAYLMLWSELVLMMGYSTLLSDLIAGLEPHWVARFLEGYLLTLITWFLQVVLRVKDQLPYD